jgi:hypothetical protein
VTTDDRPDQPPAPTPTPPAALPPATVPPDPEAYDSERAVHARARGLPAPYIPGGSDPDPDGGLEEERRYGRLLIWMIVVIVLAGFVLGFIGMLIIGGNPAP